MAQGARRLKPENGVARLSPLRHIEASWWVGGGEGRAFTFTFALAVQFGIQHGGR